MLWGAWSSSAPCWRLKASSHEVRPPEGEPRPRGAHPCLAQGTARSTLRAPGPRSPDVGLGAVLVLPLVSRGRFRAPRRDCSEVARRAPARETMTCIDCGHPGTIPRSQRCGPCSLRHRGRRAIRKTSGWCACGQPAKRGSLRCGPCGRAHRKVCTKAAQERYRARHRDALRAKNRLLNQQRRRRYLTVRIARLEAKLARLKALLTKP